MSDCNHEEADTRIVVHAFQQGMKKSNCAPLRKSTPVRILYIVTCINYTYNNYTDMHMHSSYCITLLHGTVHLYILLSTFS